MYVAYSNDPQTCTFCVPPVIVTITVKTRQIFCQNMYLFNYDMLILYYHSRDQTLMSCHSSGS